MLLLITIFFGTIIVVSVTAIVGFSTYLKSRSKSLESENQKQFLGAPPYRSLFEPTDEEIREREKAEKAELNAKTAEEERRVLQEKTEKVYEFEKSWRSSPGRLNTIQLLFFAAQSENGKIFTEISENVIQHWRENRIENLTAQDLAELLDSHFRTLPQQERTSGAIFRLKEEIAELRRESEVQPD